MARWSFVAAFLLTAAELFLWKGRRAKLGFVRRLVRARGYTWSYLEKQNATTIGDKSATVIFVHGFSSDKHAWLDVAMHVTADLNLRLLVPDLPGHGATTPFSSKDDFGVHAQVWNLEAFISQTVGLDSPVHLVGYSMGGLIAGVFAATFPHLVQSLTLVSPAGITMPTKSPVVRLFDDDGIALMAATTVDDVEALLDFADSKRGTRSRTLLKMYAAVQKSRESLVTKIFYDLEPERSTLEEHIPRIDADMVVLWGKEDQILDVSCVQRIQALGRRTVVVNGCGHDLPSARPQLCADHISRMIVQSRRRDKMLDTSTYTWTTTNSTLMDSMYAEMSMHD
ncbi:Aste57867_200 [Aphanomyces stellatus]|uniref:Aste57867_200 protein n=1 Tax=Aphanomyces stellatus TaxID=120398 RepID=A0A485K4J8_9STRA|nr:hypothetical protein As57867_000200 [Aphanomyces stellatus]VFT77426.1 Aste57867_200 [Aphanomyces stellatus]